MQLAGFLFLGRKIEHAPTSNVPYEFFTQYSHSIHAVRFIYTSIPDD